MAAARRHRVAVVVGALLVTVVASVRTSVAAEDPDWRELIERMVDASDGSSFEGELVVVSFEPHGPRMGGARVTHAPGGRVVTSGSRSWMLGHLEDETLFGDLEAGTLLRIGGERRETFSVGLLDANYRGEVVGEAETSAGAGAVVVELTPRGGDHVRERLHVDESTGIVVRRETFGEEGEPVRLVAFTSLDEHRGEVPDVEDDWVEEEVAPVAAPLSDRGIDILRGMGWTVPDELPGGFDLRAAFALGEGDGSSLHLLYSDGLYALSVYGQEGHLDDRAMLERGAHRTELGRLSVYRSPDAVPAAYVWGGDAMTYTAVSDAPPDLLGTALVVFPHERRRPMLDRVRRGIGRGLDLLWPFG
jgi:negative regulator of sigma E activity